MKKIFTFLILFFTVFLSISSNEIIAMANIKDEMVLRYILTDIKWSEANEEIVVNFIVIQKEKSKEPISYLTEHSFQGVELEGDWNEESITNYLKKNEYNYVYKRDSILGNNIDLFADISNKQLSEEDLAKLIDDAKNTADQNMKNPEKYTSVIESNNSNDWFGKINTNFITPLMFIVFTAGIIYVIVWGFTGIVSNFFSSLTFRAYRKLLLDNTFITSIAIGLILQIAMYRTEYILQLPILIIGSIVIFILSFFVITVRNKSKVLPALWSIICVAWAILLPIPI